MDDKQNYTSNENNNTAIPITSNETNDKSKNAQVVYPIIVEGESIGSVILLSKEPNEQMTEVEKKVVQSAASFLGTQMEF